MMENAIPDVPPSSSFDQFRSGALQKWQRILDRWAPFSLYRWMATVALILIYAVRVYYLEGFYIITYALGIYILGLLIGFITPQVDPELEGPVLPSKSSDEFRPFIRRLPEFKFWYSFTKAVCIAFVCTFFKVLDVPVFWPILVMYWLILCAVTMKKQIMHMIKHKYVPFTVGKQRYSKRPSASYQKDSEEEIDRNLEVVAAAAAAVVPEAAPEIPV